MLTAAALEMILPSKPVLMPKSAWMSSLILPWSMQGQQERTKFLKNVREFIVHGPSP